MADSREGNVIVAPGYTQKAEVVPVEILASEVSVFQKGCTLAASQGGLRAGLALKVSNDIYSGAATSEHASVVGFLRDSVDASGATPIHEANIVFGAKALKASTIHYTDTVQDARTVADAVIVEGDATVTSATAAFTAEDVGRTISGSGIPAGATIVTRNSATSIELSAPANHADVRTVTDAVTVNWDATLTSATANFTAADVGKTVTGAGIPGATTILSVTSATEVEMSANATGAGTTVVIGTASKSSQSITVGANVNGLAAATLTTLAGDMGGKYIATQGYFKF